MKIVGSHLPNFLIVHKENRKNRKSQKYSVTEKLFSVQKMSSF